jgi:predicted nucleic acid-binding protein
LAISQYPRPILSGIAAIEAIFGSQSTSELKQVRAVIATFDVVWPSDAEFQNAANQFGKLKLSHGIGILDAISASTALTRGYDLATFNVKHFRAISGLTVIKPY